MCGIAGYMYSDRDRSVDAEILVSMAAIQHHRGPDGFGYKRMRGVGFSHARLSIVDLNESRARQPFESQDGNLMLTTNGELYDYQRIRADLTSKGSRFTTKSDSEIILHLYSDRGLEGMLPHLRGEFAFALFDKKEDCLYLVRDRFGVKPLYWAVEDDVLVFGSELKVLFAHPGMSRKFDPEGVYHQLMQTIVPGSTAFKGVKQVKPGHVISIKRQDGKFRVTEKKYWDMPFPEITERDKQKDESYWIDAVREKLLESVQLRLEADVPVGCYLSGGIDSCSIIGLAAAARQDPIKAFTIGFDDKKYDESSIASEMARSIQADHDILKLDASLLYDNFQETLWHTERTIYNTLGVAKFLMSRHVKSVDHKVVLTGEGSDELFGGYPAFRRDMFLYGLDYLDAQERAQWEQLLSEQNKLFKGAMLAENETSNEALTKKIGFTPSCLQPWLATSARVPSLLSDDYKQKLCDYDAGLAIANELDSDFLDNRHPLDKAQYVWIKTMLEGQILTWGGDRVDMANSMEARPAFLDHHLAELAATIPPSLRIKGKTEKYVLREAMKGLLPEVLYKREKFAFMAPPAHTDKHKWLAMNELADEYLSSEAIKEAGLLSESGVRSIFDLHENGNITTATQNELDAIINHMLGIQILHEQFIATDIPALAKAQARNLGWLN